MKARATLLLATLFLFAFGAVAQHTQHHPPEKAQPEKPKAQMMGKEMMGEGMMAHHQEMESLLDQLLDNQAALEAEQNPAARKEKLAAQRALLEKLQSKMQQRREMMQQMAEHMRTCPLMGSQPKREKE